MRTILKGFKFEKNKFFYNKKNIFILLLCLILSFGLVSGITYASYQNNSINNTFEKQKEYYQTQKEISYYCYEVSIGNNPSLPENISQNMIPNISKENAKNYYNDYLMYDYYLKTETTYNNYVFYDYSGKTTSNDIALIYLDIIFGVSCFSLIIFSYTTNKKEENMNYIKNIKMSKIDINKFMIGKNLFTISFILICATFYFALGFIFNTPYDVMLKNNEFIVMNFKWLYLIKYIEVVLSILVFDFILKLILKYSKNFKQYLLINIAIIGIFALITIGLNLIFKSGDYFNVCEYIIIISLFNFYPTHFYLLMMRLGLLVILLVLCYLFKYLILKRKNVSYSN